MSDLPEQFGLFETAPGETWPAVQLSYEEAVEELQDSLDVADQQANVDPEAEGYPEAADLTNEELVLEWATMHRERLVLTDPDANPNG